MRSLRWRGQQQAFRRLDFLRKRQRTDLPRPASLHRAGEQAAAPGSRQTSSPAKDMFQPAKASLAAS